MFELNLTPVQEDRARELHEKALVIDTHCDTIMGVVNGKYGLGVEREDGHIDLPRLMRGGVTTQLFACYIEPQHKPTRSLRRCVQMIDAIYAQAEQNSNLMEIAFTAADVQRIHGLGKVAAIISIEGGEAIEGDLGVLRMLHKLGVRAIGLTWNQRNDIADGVGEVRAKGGLTNFGVSAIQEMNRLGIIIDVSHLTKPGFWDVIELSTAPIMASHSNAEAMCNHPRNLDDDQIRALAKNGGVMGMNFCPPFVVETGTPTLNDMLDHVDHIVKLVGPNHVGIGSDFDGIGSTPVGLEDVSKMVNFTRGLVARGYSDEDILKILGGNYLRIFQQIFP